MKNIVDFLFLNVIYSNKEKDLTDDLVELSKDFLTDLQPSQTKVIHKLARDEGVDFDDISWEDKYNFLVSKQDIILARLH